MNYINQQRAAQDHFDNMSEPEAAISEEAFQDACGDVSLAMDSDDLAELVSVLSEAAPALALIANTTGFTDAYSFQMRDLLSKCEAIRTQVEEQARLMQ